MKKVDTFILLLFGVIILAWLWPYPGAEHPNFSLSEVAGWGVSLIFFFYGLRLSPNSLKEGLKNIKLHVVVHCATFVLFPLIVLSTLIFTDWAGDNFYIWLGVYFLATLPSTVSSSVVMVSIARGNIPAAIFNASISSLMGVFLTPLLMSIFLTSDGGGNSLHTVIIKLIFQVLVPVTAGMLLHRYWGVWAENHKRQLKISDQTVILLIVYTAFCEGFKSGIFSTVSYSTLLLLTVGMTALFFAVYYIIYWATKILKFSREDRITALYCGSKKSLVHGTVMSKVIFSNPNILGLILLPIMIYHAMQLIVVSFLANNENRKV